MIARYAADHLSLLLRLPILLVLVASSCAATTPSSEFRFVLSNNSYTQISPKAIVSDACVSYQSLEKLNVKVNPAINDLTGSTDFFSYYRLNLFNKKCPFWDDENGMCGNIACAVETVEDEDDIPEVWRASELGKLEGPSAKHPAKSSQEARPKKPLQGSLGEDVGESCVVEYDDECDERDYCMPEDESATSKGDYVSLLQNPERFTGYAGDGAKQVWEAIYRENCFQKSSFPHSAQLGISSNQGIAAMDFKSVLDAAGRQQVLEEKRQDDPNLPFVAKTGLEAEDECIEKRVFYRVISGMHASISTHLCWDFLNQTTGQWQPNVGCYVNRLHKFPDRISNLYFNYALVTRAIAKLGPHLQGYTYCTGDRDQDSATRAKVLAVVEKASSVREIFDESLMFKNGEGPSLKEDFRNRFRNVSRLMDCVGCDKCRLWGKLQTAGYGTALKVLFEFDNASNDIPVLKRTELVALFNTYARLSSSLSSIFKFRGMVHDDGTERQDAAKIGESMESLPEWVKKPRHVVPSPESEPSPPPIEFDEDEEEEPEPTVGDMFKQELGVVIKAFKLVMKSWISFPGTMLEIILTETKRLYQFWVGLPVTPRTWQFQRPSLDEL